MRITTERLEWMDHLSCRLQQQPSQIPSMRFNLLWIILQGPSYDKAPVPLMKAWQAESQQVIHSSSQHLLYTKEKGSTIIKGILIVELFHLFRGGDVCLLPLDSMAVCLWIPTAVGHEGREANFLLLHISWSAVWNTRWASALIQFSSS